MEKIDVPGLSLGAQLGDEQTNKTRQTRTKKTRRSKKFQTELRFKEMKTSPHLLGLVCTSSSVALREPLRIARTYHTARWTYLRH